MRKKRKEIKAVEIRIPEWREETGKCLNCGKETPFYDEGYFCTCKCRKKYINGKDAQ